MDTHIILQEIWARQNEMRHCIQRAAGSPKVIVYAESVVLCSTELHQYGKGLLYLRSITGTCESGSILASVCSMYLFRDFGKQVEAF